MKRIPPPVIGLLALVVAAAGCGSSTSMSDTASHQLETLVATVRTATVARDRPRAKRALASLRHSVHSLVVSGDTPFVCCSAKIGSKRCGSGES